MKIKCEYEKTPLKPTMSCFMGEDRNGKKNDCWKRSVTCEYCIYGTKIETELEKKNVPDRNNT